MSTILELLRFLRNGRKYWLFPVIALLLTLGAALVLAESSVIAPFIYTLF